mmetsp:Transcript_1903/g.3301  ORF Transcript_1903/g.3301 Transcript_1903/m.3301 type:complete len:156 (+) Transcript_1903:209-676(+)
MVCKMYLEDGSYRVRGTVRSTKNPKKIDPLKNAFGSHFDKLELVEADLNDKESLIKACQGAKYIVHTASPFPLVAPKNEDDVVKPAVNGTLAILEAAKLNKVKKVVITSSCVSIYVTNDRSKVDFTRDDWSDPAICSPYEKSKTLAERAAWDFQK